MLERNNDEKYSKEIGHQLCLTNIIGDLNVLRNAYEAIIIFNKTLKINSL